MFKALCNLCRSRISPLLAGIFVGVLSASVSWAGLISGPTLNTDDAVWTASGLGFTATVNATLTSFTFQNQGAADVVDLVDSVGDVLDSVAIPASTPSDTVPVSWSLTEGVQYYLLQTTAANSLFTTWGVAAPSDAEIALTDTGDFSLSLDSADFAIGGASSGGTDSWAAFNNITTTSGGSSIPEPASLTLVLPFAVAIFWHARRKRLLR